MGNKLGWIIAGGIVVLFLVVIVLVAVLSGSNVTSADQMPGLVAFREVSIPVAEIAGFTPDGDGNAGEDYKKAIDLAARRHKAIAVELHSGNMSTALQVMAWIKKGAKKKKMEYVGTCVAAEFTVAPGFGPAMDIGSAAGTAERLAEVYADRKQYAKAAEAMRHSFVMGWHFVGERAHIATVRAGISAQVHALERLGPIYSKWEGHEGDLEKVEAYKRKLEPFKEYYGIGGKKMRLLWNIKPHPGEVFYAVKRDKDRAWRVRALLTLGLLKHTADTSADAKYARTLIDQFVEKGGKLEKKAAKAAKEFTVLDAKAIGSQ